MSKNKDEILIENSRKVYKAIRTVINDKNKRHIKPDYALLSEFCNHIEGLSILHIKDALDWLILNKHITKGKSLNMLYYELV